MPVVPSYIIESLMRSMQQAPQVPNNTGDLIDLALQQVLAGNKEYAAHQHHQ